MFEKKTAVTTVRNPSASAPLGRECLASKMISVEGKPVSLMYRVEPLNATDSGWKFFSGLEDDEYITNLRNIDIVDLDAIAEKNSGIISLLSAPVNTAFERNEETGEFLPVFDFEFLE